MAFFFVSPIAGLLAKQEMDVGHRLEREKRRQRCSEDCPPTLFMEGGELTTILARRINTRMAQVMDIVCLSRDVERFVLWIVPPQLLHMSEVSHPTDGYRNKLVALSCIVQLSVTVVCMSRI